MKHLNLISYFGGKFPHLSWLISKFPRGNYHFVDIMCGSANVALNVNYPLVTINDLNNNVINLFEVLRNNPDEFFRALYFTPFARKELEQIVNDKNDIQDKVELARRYFVRSQLGYGANGSQNNHHGFGLEYKLQSSNFYRVDNWNAKLAKLPSIIDKLRGFQIENKSMFDLFERVNNQDTIVYFDPPYLFSTRSSRKRYQFEWDIEDHQKLACLVKNAVCKVAISGYDDDQYDKLFPDYFKTNAPPSRSNVRKRLVQECLWTNYNPEEYGSLKLDL